MKDRSNPQNRTRRVFAAAALAVILAAALAWQIRIFLREDAEPYFCDGVTADGLALGGKTWQEGLALAEENNRLRGETLLFALEQGGDRWLVDGGEVGAFNTETILEQAWAVGRRDPLWLRYLERMGARLAGWAFHTDYSLDDTLLESRLRSVSAELYTPPADARVTGFDPEAPAGERIHVREDTPGYGLDVPAMLRACREAFEGKGWGTVVPMALGTVEADVTAEALRAMDPPRVRYGFRPDDYHEIRASLDAQCRALGAVVLDPGESLSLRQRLAAGGLSASERRVYVPTALYGAALQAGLTVTRRSGDAELVLPVAPGLEAVTGGSDDLELRNDTGGSMVIWLRAEEGQLTAEVYRLPYEDCAYVRLVGVAEGEESPRVYRIFCDEDGRELGRERVEQ